MTIQDYRFPTQTISVHMTSKKQKNIENMVTLGVGSSAQRRLAKNVLLALTFTTIAAENPLLDPAAYTKWVETSSDGLSRKAVISVPFVNSTGK